MRATLFALFSMMFYSGASVTIERKLSGIPPLGNMLFFYPGALAVILIAVAFRQPLGLAFTMPQPEQYLSVFICGVLWIIGDFCFFSAYHSGGSLMTVMTISLLLPVFASLIKLIIGGGAPTLGQMAGWALAIGAVILAGR